MNCNQLVKILVFAFWGIGCQTSYEIKRHPLWKKTGLKMFEFGKRNDSLLFRFQNGFELEQAIRRKQLANGFSIIHIRRSLPENRVRLLFELQYEVPRLAAGHDGALQLLPDLVFNESFHQELAKIKGQLKVIKKSTRTPPGHLTLLLTLPRKSFVGGVGHFFRQLSSAKLTLSDFLLVQKKRLQYLTTLQQSFVLQGYRELLKSTSPMGSSPANIRGLEVEIADTKKATLGQAHRLYHYTWRGWKGSLVVLGKLKLPSELINLVAELGKDNSVLSNSGNEGKRNLFAEKKLERSLLQEIDPTDVPQIGAVVGVVFKIPRQEPEKSAHMLIKSYFESRNQTSPRKEIEHSTAYKTWYVSGGTYGIFRDSSGLMSAQESMRGVTKQEMNRLFLQATLELSAQEKFEKMKLSFMKNWSKDLENEVKTMLLVAQMGQTGQSLEAIDLIRNNVDRLSHEDFLKIFQQELTRNKPKVVKASRKSKPKSFAH